MNPSASKPAWMEREEEAAQATDDSIPYAMETFICVRCGNPLTDDGIELAGKVYDRACVTADEVRADTERRYPEGR